MLSEAAERIGIAKSAPYVEPSSVASSVPSGAVTFPAASVPGLGTCRPGVVGGHPAVANHAPARGQIDRPTRCDYATSAGDAGSAGSALRWRSDGSGLVPVTLYSSPVPLP